MRPAAPASSSVPSPASSSATVLLVDDEAPIRNSLGPYLERSGHRVLLAGDGVEALDLLGAYDAKPCRPPYCKTKPTTASRWTATATA